MSMSEAQPSIGRAGRVMVVILEVVALLVAAGAVALGVTQAALALVGERISVAYPVTAAIPQDRLLSAPSMSMASAAFSEMSVAVSGFALFNRILLAISAVLATAGIVAIALTVALLCRRVLKALPVVRAIPAALVTAGTALLVGIVGSQMFLLGAEWSVSEHWDGDPLFRSSGWFDPSAATVAFDSTPLLIALFLYVLAGILAYAHHRERADRQQHP